MPILQLFGPILLDYYRCIIGINLPFEAISSDASTTTVQNKLKKEGFISSKIPELKKQV
jgi:hypothetical protein